MITIKINSNQFEDALILTSEDGQVIEAVVTHIPGATNIPTFHLGTYDSTQGPEETYQELFTCPAQ